MINKCPIGEKLCVNCDLGAVEDAKHVVLQCPFNQDIHVRYDMFKSVHRLESGLIERILSDHGNVHRTCMGWCPEDERFGNMKECWCCTSDYISKMYT